MKGRDLYFILILAVVMVYFLATYTGAELQLADEYLDLLPSFIVILITGVMAKSMRGVGQVASFFFLGVGFALLVDGLNTVGAIIPTWLLNWGCTLQYLQAVLIILFTVGGLLFSRL